MNQDDALRRVVVVGTSGAGKTTFGRNLSRALARPHVELDDLYWGPDWTPRESDEFMKRLQEATRGGEWIVDGNYQFARDVLWPQATSIVWLNYSFMTVFLRALRRTVRRSVYREDLFAGNHESLGRAFFRKDSILLWVITTYRRRKQQYSEVRSSGMFPALNWIELKSPREAEEFLSRVAVDRLEADRRRSS